MDKPINISHKKDGLIPLDVPTTNEEESILVSMGTAKPRKGMTAHGPSLQEAIVQAKKPVSRERVLEVIEEINDREAETNLMLHELQEKFADLQTRSERNRSYVGFLTQMLDSAPEQSPEALGITTLEVGTPTPDVAIESEQIHTEEPKTPEPPAVEAPQEEVHTETDIPTLHEPISAQVENVAPTPEVAAVEVKPEPAISEQPQTHAPETTIVMPPKTKPISQMSREEIESELRDTRSAHVPLMNKLSQIVYVQIPGTTDQNKIEDLKREEREIEKLIKQYKAHKDDLQAALQKRIESEKTSVEHSDITPTPTAAPLTPSTPSQMPPIPVPHPPVDTVAPENTAPKPEPETAGTPETTPLQSTYDLVMKRFSLDGKPAQGEAKKPEEVAVTKGTELPTQYEAAVKRWGLDAPTEAAGETVNTAAPNDLASALMEAAQGTPTPEVAPVTEPPLDTPADAPQKTEAGFVAQKGSLEEEDRRLLEELQGIINSTRTPESIQKEERMREILATMKATGDERAEKAGVVEQIKNIGGWWQGQPMHRKLAFSCGLILAGAGSAAVGGVVGGFGSGAVMILYGITRSLGGAAMFTFLKNKLEGRADAQGLERTRAREGTEIGIAVIGAIVASGALSSLVAHSGPIIDQISVGASRAAAAAKAIKDSVEGAFIWDVKTGGPSLGGVATEHVASTPSMLAETTPPQDIETPMPEATTTEPLAEPVKPEYVLTEQQIPIPPPPGMEQLPQVISPEDPQILKAAENSLRSDVDSLLGSKGIFGMGAQSGMDSIDWKDRAIGFSGQTVDKIMGTTTFPTAADGSQRFFGLESADATRKMQEYIKKVAGVAGVAPSPGENVANYIKRAATHVLVEQAKLPATK